jgi:hypothetical protein
VTLARPRNRAAAALASAALIFVAIRWWLARTPALSETYYDEALTGLMAMAILRGEPQVFYWGQPYLGAVDAYLAAAGFWLAGPSALVLRLSVVVAAISWLLAAWATARRIVGPAWALVAALAVALPPVFLSFVQLSAHGQTMAATLAAVALGAGAALIDPAAPPGPRSGAWLVLGLAGGLGWWASQTVGVFLLAVALAVPIARPHVLREPGPYVALGAFAVGSLPFWAWNVRHELATFWHLATWGDPLPPRFADRAAIVAGTVARTVGGHYWDGKAVGLPLPGRLLGGIATGVYGGAVLLAVASVGTWVRRLRDRERPWQGPLDLVVLAFWLTVLAHLLTWFGTSGVLRYALTFYVTLPVLAAAALARTARWRPGGRALAAAAAGGLVAYGALTHVAFVERTRGLPSRPVDALLARLDTLGIRACYADSRIAQVVTFESAGRILCADHYGLRNFAYLQAVDAVEDAATVALVTHRRIEGPPPAQMATLLRALGARYEREVIGNYVVFHGFEASGPPLRPIAPAGWRLAGPSAAGDPRLAFDRQVWTSWAPEGPGGPSATLDLGQVHALAQLVIEGSGASATVLSMLRLETSADGRTWELALQAESLLSGGHWWRGHPRLDETGRFVLRFPPRPARLVRLRGGLQDRLAISELFAYEATPGSWAPPDDAQEALRAAARALDRWMDDPGGPHPKRAPVTAEHRRRQVRWGPVFAGLDRALTLAPDWEDAHHLHNRAIAIWGWSSSPDVRVERARADGAWTEVLRWADVADRERPGLSRSGRVAARAEALERLGRLGEAAAVRATAGVDATPRPAQVVFGDAVELLAVALPAEARRGERTEMRCTWRLARRPAHDYTASVHIQGPERLVQHDHPLGADFGTSRWSVGEVVEERLELEIPRATPPGRYDVAVGLWTPATGRRLAAAGSTLPARREAVLVGSLTILP